MGFAQRDIGGGGGGRGGFDRGRGRSRFPTAPDGFKPSEYHFTPSTHSDSDHHLITRPLMSNN